MNLVKNTKTVIFDDKPEEIEQLRKALDNLLIQSIFINFSEPPLTSSASDTLTNVRFIFADILLGDFKEPDSTKAVEPIVASITQNISKNNGVFVLILWSKDTTNHKQELIRVLKEDEKYKFFPIESINKSDYIGATPSKNVSHLIVEIKNAFTEDLVYFDILREWESEIQKSSTKVFDLFLDINDQSKTKDLLNGAIKSVVGTKQKPDSGEKRKALWTSLNMVIQDTIEKNVSSCTDTPITEKFEALDLKIQDTKNGYMVNSKLMFEMPPSSNKKMFPGNIFSFNSYISTCTILKQKVCGYKNIDSLLDEVLNSDEVDQYIELQNKMTKREKTAFRKRTRELLQKYPILLEFTPFCDYSQTSYKKARLIFGFLIPEQHLNLILKSTKYLYPTSVFHICGISNIADGNYAIILNIKHIFGLDPNILESFDLLFRARKELVNDIQHNIAYHISRVGVTSL